ncbi:hypothetical protein HGM15179_002612 [Zosterops borbonicus]|uniref:Uncharacterized protein n=1 Tax=Zosterops borbonicus TaxID=364589 RepID=A0A8K1GSB3_9PASS|nr:hypothetical protein HGM15179_002612 [Zosterops borbonicus]
MRARLAPSNGRSLASGLGKEEQSMGMLQSNCLSLTKVEKREKPLAAVSKTQWQIPDADENTVKNLPIGSALSLGSPTASPMRTSPIDEDTLVWLPACKMCSGLNNPPGASSWALWTGSLILGCPSGGSGGENMAGCWQIM